MLGNARLKAMCFDGVTRVCNIRGSLRQQVSVGIYFTLIKKKNTFKVFTCASK